MTVGSDGGALSGASDNPASRKGSESTGVVASSGNVYADLGLPNPEAELRAADARIAGLAEPKKRVSRRRKGVDAEQDLAADFAAAAYPVDASQPDLRPAAASEEVPARLPEDLAVLADGGLVDAADGVATVPTDQDIADEIEAEKVWALAGKIRAANTAWGVDEGIDADVREARALMAEARRQVRENAPIGAHYRADGPELRSVA